MKPQLRLAVLCVTLISFLVAPGLALAQSPSYDLTWWSVDSGGGALTGGGYQLSATIGQPDAGQMSGGGYTLGGGFWGGGELAAPAGPTIYLPLIIR
jgi:hypothetical protein